MNRLSFLRTAVGTFALVVAASAASAAPAAEKSVPKSHPLRGVITRVEADSSSLMVKHEAIPGVMRAMTMRFRVAPDVVKTFKVGDAITGMMSRKNDQWVLDDVKPAPSGKTK